MNQNNTSQASTGINRRRHIFIIISLVLLFAFLEIFSNFPGITTPTERLELSIRDTAFRMRGPRATNPDFVIVAIDDDSLNWRGERWPWSRDYIAEIIEYLNNDGASIIALDFTLFDPTEDPEDDFALVQALDNAKASVTVNQITKTDFTTTLDIPLPIYQGKSVV